jgi:hypothetical protein
MRKRERSTLAGARPRSTKDGGDERGTCSHGHDRAAGICQLGNDRLVTATEGEREEFGYAIRSSNAQRASALGSALPVGFADVGHSKIADGFFVCWYCRGRIVRSPNTVSTCVVPVCNTPRCQARPHRWTTLLILARRAAGYAPHTASLPRAVCCCHRLTVRTVLPVGCRDAPLPADTCLLGPMLHRPRAPLCGRSCSAASATCIYHVSSVH